MPPVGRRSSASVDPPEVTEDEPARPRRVRFDDGDVEPEGRARERPTVGKLPGGEETEDCAPEAGELPSVDGLFGPAEGPAPPPTDLDDDELSRRSRVEGDEIELVSPDPHLTAEDVPAGEAEVAGDDGLGGVTKPLTSCPHGSIVAPPTYRRLNGAGSSATLRTRGPSTAIARGLSRPRHRTGRPSRGPGRRSPVGPVRSASAPAQAPPTSASQRSSCSISAQEAKLRRWIGLRPSRARAARCSGAA